MKCQKYIFIQINSIIFSLTKKSLFPFFCFNFPCGMSIRLFDSVSISEGNQMFSIKIQPNPMIHLIPIRFTICVWNWMQASGNVIFGCRYFHSFSIRNARLYIIFLRCSTKFRKQKSHWKSRILNGFWWWSIGESLSPAGSVIAALRLHWSLIHHRFVRLPLCTKKTPLRVFGGATWDKSEPKAASISLRVMVSVPSWKL